MNHAYLFIVFCIILFILPHLFINYQKIASLYDIVKQSV